MNYLSIVIALVSLAISIFTFWKTLFDERQRQDFQVIAVHSPESLITPKIGIVYLEVVITNNSTLPLALISSTMNLKKTGILKVELSSSAYLFKTLISTHIESTGSKETRKSEKTSDSLPTTIKPKEAMHLILAYPAENVLGVDSETTEIDFLIETNRKQDIYIPNETTNPKMKSTKDVIYEKYREF